MARRHGLLLAMSVALAGCGFGVHLQPTAAPDVLAQVRAACATTPYRNCERDALEIIQSVPHLTLVAICDLGDGMGQVITTLSVKAADRDCSSGGTVPSAVVAVIGIP
jgi:hypothetical protein